MYGMLIWWRKKIVSRSWSSVLFKPKGSALTFATRKFRRGQGGDEIEGHVDRRIFHEYLRMAEVLFRSVVPDPWHLVLARQDVLVQRLMHVPKDGEVEGRSLVRHKWTGRPASDEGAPPEGEADHENDGYARGR